MAEGDDDAVGSDDGESEAVADGSAVGVAEVEGTGTLLVAVGVGSGLVGDALTVGLAICAVPAAPDLAVRWGEACRGAPATMCTVPGDELTLAVNSPEGLAWRLVSRLGALTTDRVWSPCEPVTCGPGLSIQPARYAAPGSTTKAAASAVSFQMSATHLRARGSGP